MVPISRQKTVVIAKPLTSVTEGAQTDGELVRQACQGALAERQQAFEVLVVRYEGFIRSLLLRLSRNAAMADDLAQDAFLNAWVKLATLKEPERFKGWLRQLAYRQFLHQYRHGKVAEKYAHLEQEDAVATLAEDDDLAALLELCNPLERELMVLCYGFEFTYVEIAEARGIAVGTVKSHIHRAKGKMQVFLNHSEANIR